MDATMIDVDVLIDFDQSKKIGAMTIRRDALPEFPNFVFALGFQALGSVSDFKGTVPRSEYLGPYRLMAIAPVDDVKYLGYLRQIGKLDDVAEGRKADQQAMTTAADLIVEALALADADRVRMGELLKQAHNLLAGTRALGAEAAQQG